MRSTARFGVCVLGAALCLGAGATARARAHAFPQDRDQAQQDSRAVDYSKNKNYKVGMRDGQYDREHNRDHSKKRQFKKDEDRKAYEAGYQQARQAPPDDRH